MSSCSGPNGEYGGQELGYFRSLVCVRLGTKRIDEEVWEQAMALVCERHER